MCHLLEYQKEKLSLAPATPTRGFLAEEDAALSCCGDDPSIVGRHTPVHEARQPWNAKKTRDDPLETHVPRVYRRIELRRLRARPCGVQGPAFWAGQSAVNEGSRTAQSVRERMNASRSTGPTIPAFVRAMDDDRAGNF